jgi:hypothetical protein
MGCVLIEDINGVENICSYASGSFHGAEINYPSIHKEILAVKKIVLPFQDLSQTNEIL